MGDVKLFSTADLDCSRSGSFRTALGVRLRLLSVMETASNRRGKKHGPNRQISPLHPGTFVSSNPDNWWLTSILPVI